jgi:hypothetical protein
MVLAPASYGVDGRSADALLVAAPNNAPALNAAPFNTRTISDAAQGARTVIQRGLPDTGEVSRLCLNARGTSSWVRAPDFAHDHGPAGWENRVRVLGLPKLSQAFSDTRVPSWASTQFPHTSAWLRGTAWLRKLWTNWPKWVGRWWSRSCRVHMTTGGAGAARPPRGRSRRAAASALVGCWWVPVPCCLVVYTELPTYADSLLPRSLLPRRWHDQVSREASMCGGLRTGVDTPTFRASPTTASTSDYSTSTSPPVFAALPPASSYHIESLL